MASEIAQTVDHALRALTAAASGGPQSIRDVSETLAVSTSAARRIVITLHAEGMLRRREDGRYDIGPRLIRMTEHLLDRYAVMAHPAMARLAAAAGRSVVLTGFRADSTMVVHQVDPSPLELHVEYRTGLTRDLTDGTDGLTILATLNAPRRARLVEESGLPGLAERLEGIRDAGYAFGINEAWGGLPGLSAPILDDNLGVIGALTVIGADRDDPVERWAGETVAAANAVAARSSELTRGPGPDGEAQ